MSEVEQNGKYQMTLDTFDFNDLFVFDIANNHQGSVERGLKIIAAMAAVARQHNVRAAIKFQFRDLDTLVHSAHKEKTTNKQIVRFLSTRLTRHDFQIMFDAVRAEGMIAMCTPFDEKSVDAVVDMGFDILKIASCSATDWPLVERAAGSGLPVICSTGGLDMAQLNSLAAILEQHRVQYAIMHCISIYPTPPKACYLNWIDVLRRRFRKHTIGWSTHEDPDDLAPIQIAVAKGARMFERHVGIQTDSCVLNSYSSSPEQIDRWISAYQYARQLCGSEHVRPVLAEEIDELTKLRRGIYVKTPIHQGQIIQRDAVYFAMPVEHGQLDSGAWSLNMSATRDLARNCPLKYADVEMPEHLDSHIPRAVIAEVAILLTEAGVNFSREIELEISHHYGIDRFHEFGAVLINCVNRSYCKKLIVLLPGQTHPLHFHKLKEETLEVLHGVMNINIDGNVYTLGPGQRMLILPNMRHSFRTAAGCVLEELSTTHHDDDSFYIDEVINEHGRAARKTVVRYGG